MVKQLVYILLIIFSIIACEEVYNPELDNVEDFLVVESILISNHTQNRIYLYKTIGFNENIETYPRVAGASVSLVDKDNNYIECSEISEGTYLLDYIFDPDGAYSLHIEHNGEIYQSEIQSVPDMPVFDSIYLGYTTKVTVEGASNSSESIKEEDGIQIYVDIDNKGDLTYYRFSFRKVFQYLDFYDTIIPPRIIPVRMPIYLWKSFYPTGLYDLAGPPEYSTSKNITKHPLEFFEKNYFKYMPDTLYFAGYIYSIYQFGLNEDTYDFYSDLNSQMDSEGKIFDPVYIQAEGNIKCISNPGKVVLGNFEISSMSEKRYYLDYYPTSDTIKLFRNIPHFYNIPDKGIIKNIQPDFWESILKSYPDE